MGRQQSYSQIILLSKGMRATFKYLLTSFVLYVVGRGRTIYWVSVEEMICLNYDI